MTSEQSVSVTVIDSLDQISANAWDAVANPSKEQRAIECSPNFPYNPFLRHDFFNALEKSGSAVRQSGWLGQHLVMQLEGSSDVLGILPCYLKNHSQGEYVFDHGWADAFERAGGNYYPKLQCSVPFTPASGRRLLVGNGSDATDRKLMLAGALQEVCARLEVSSAHITFMDEGESKLLSQHDYLQRNDQQYHWVNHGYKSFDEFLANLSSRKRKNIKKERIAALKDNGITIDWLTGADLTEDIWDTFYNFYIDTGSRKWGQPYLTRKFYSMIGETMADDIVLIMAKRNGHYVAGAINFVGSHTLFGRHWGCIEDHPFLHFEVCYYQAIDYAIEHGLDRVEAGAQGEHKLQRGYMPHITHSAHFITHPDFRAAVENYLESERHAVQREVKLIARHGPFKAINKDKKDFS